MRVLVVEDDPKISSALRRGLENAGYAVDTVAEGNDALWIADHVPFDCVVLDVMLPDISGFEVCHKLREKAVWSPVLMLTARNAVEDRVSGLDAGADDYLAKPFDFDELLARVRALIRRGPSTRPVRITVGDVTLDPAAQTVTHDGKEIKLTAKEFAVLEYLMRHAGDVVSRTEIMEHVWDWNFEGLSNVVDVYVRNLRKKIDGTSGASLIETVRGSGYRIVTPLSAAS